MISVVRNAMQNNRCHNQEMPRYGKAEKLQKESGKITKKVILKPSRNKGRQS